MTWKLKQDAVMAIINELDQSEPRTPNKNEAIRRRTKNLITIAFKNTEIRDTANEIIYGGSMPIKDLQGIFDERLMPLVERDLDETINNWWQLWK